MNILASKVAYSIDSSSLLHGWRRIYRPKNFGFIWRKLDFLIEEGRLRASIEVLTELAKKDDDLYAWCKDRRNKLFVEIDDTCQHEVSRILGRYPRLVDTKKGRSGGDPFVIALAAISQPRMTVLTEETPGGMKIPDVCRGENILCMGLADMIEQEDWRFD